MADRVEARATPTARSRPTSRSSAPAWRAWPRRSSWSARGALLRGAGGARPRRRPARVGRASATATGSTSAASGSAPPRTGSYALAREHGAATFPTWTAGENVVEIGGRLTRYTGTIPRCARTCWPTSAQAMLRLDRMAAKVPLEAPWDGAEGEAVGQPDRLVVDAPQHGHPGRPRDAGDRGEGGLGGDAGRRLAAAPALLHRARPASWTCCSTPRAARSRTASSRARARSPRGSPRRSATGWCCRRPVRRIEWTADGVRVHGRRRRGARAARDRGGAAHARRAHLRTTRRCPGYRDQLTQRVPMGAVIKCFAIYDEPFWRARGPERQRRQRRGPADADVRQLAARRLARASSSASSRATAARELGRVERGASAARRCSRNLARLFGPRAARPERLHREELGRRGVEPRLLRGLHAARAC